MFIEILVCVLAGLGAGLGTGFAGLSAATVISPMLMIILNVPAYEAVGIALASDVLASSLSAATYAKNKNIDIKNGLVMMISVLIFTVVGSYVAGFVNDVAMGGVSLAFMLGLGLKFLIKPTVKTEQAQKETSKIRFIIVSVACGMFVGFICGFVGVGGGMLMLLLLTSVLGYELKMAVGTSVFIMSFTAFTGAASRFVIGGFPNWLYLDVCILSTLFFATLASKVANKSKPKTLNRIVGAVLVVTCITTVIIEIIQKL
ncbi:MAG: sulfite exporter TauE/SafE family protein [Clostridia bacterium]|nr:sulfite exporter TauE/SafE family protein [Clostridia bacterium]